MMMPLTDPLPDNELLHQLREGDGTALSALYRKHSGPLFRFALLQGGSPATANDVVQETFLALLDNKGQFDPLQGSLGSYLFGVARNLMHRHLQLAKRWVARDDAADEFTPDAALPPMEKLLQDETVEAVRVALQKVAPHYREVLILYEMHDFSYTEAASACSIDIGTVRSRLHRGRAQLAALLQRAGLVETTSGAPRRSQLLT